MNKFIFIITILSCYIFYSCSKEEGEAAPIEIDPNIEMIVYDASETTAFSTILKGRIKSNIQIQEYGFYLWTDENESFKEEIIATNIQEDGSFETHLTNLQFATTYYFCTYAIIDDKEYRSKNKTLHTEQKAIITFSDIRVFKSVGNSITIQTDIAKNLDSHISEVGYYISSTNDQLYSPDNIHIGQLQNNHIYTDAIEIPKEGNIYISTYAINPTGEYHNTPLILPALTNEGSNANYIDLGLPSGTLWAEYNIGASSNTEAGGYYAWGEIIQSEEPYSLYKEPYSYVNEEGYIITVPGTNIDIGSNIAYTQYDVAHMTWGGLWQMPTSEDFQELFSNTERQYAQKNGINGELRIAPNGNTLFLPYRGHYGKLIKEGLRYDNRIGYYWASTAPEGYLDIADNVYLYDRNNTIGTITVGIERFHHNNVRAVWKNKAQKSTNNTTKHSNSQYGFPF